MISIAIPNYNGKKYLNNCLKSIYKNSYQPNEVIVIDNGSTDGSIEFLEAEYKKLKIIRNSKNLGFAKAANQGIRESRNDYVALINNDVTLDKNWLKTFEIQIRKGNKKKVASWCGTVLTADGNIIESRGLSYCISGKASNIGNGERYNKKTGSAPQYIFGASGAATVYNRKAVIKAGLFDNDFFAYQEDVDLSLRLQKMGFRAIFLHEAICYHLGGFTSGKMGNFRQRMVLKNWIYIIIKNYPSKTIIKYLPQIGLERMKNLYDFLKNTSLIKIIPDMGLIFIQIMLKFPKMISRRSPVDEKILKQEILDKYED